LRRKVIFHVGNTVFLTEPVGYFESKYIIVHYIVNPEWFNYAWILFCCCSQSEGKGRTFYVALCCSFLKCLYKPLVHTAITQFTSNTLTVHLKLEKIHSRPITSNTFLVHRVVWLLFLVSFVEWIHEGFHSLFYYWSHRVMELY
jgi:hypothetical protein